MLTYRLSYGYARTADLRRDGSVRFTVHVELSDPTVILPQWSWPKETPDQARDVARFRDNVMVHERGHWQIARDYVAHRDRSEWLPQTTTRAQAAVHFKKYFDTIVAGLDNAQAFYDNVTQHGRTQHRAPLYGFLDGDDTYLTCDFATPRFWF